MNANESIVHEWSILYSNRIFQKDKKWCDGKLKYFEFNNKVEVLNEDDQLIEVDFITPKFASNFTNGNQIRLPGNRILVEIDSHLSTYSRDISELSKRVKREHANIDIKREITQTIKRNKKAVPGISIKEEPNARVTPLKTNLGSVRERGLASSFVNGRSSNAASIRVKKEISKGCSPARATPVVKGVSAVPESDVQQLHAIKKEFLPFDSNPNSFKLEKTNHSLNPHQYKTTAVAKQSRPLIIASFDSCTNKKQNVVQKMPVSSSIIKPSKVRKRQRIPPKSSSIFKYLGSFSLI